MGASYTRVGRGTAMIALRNFCVEDALDLQRWMFSDLTIEAIRSMISDWNRGTYEGMYFEMLAIVQEKTLVGMISLYQHSADEIGIGPQVFEAHRRQGIATQAMRLAMALAKEKGYRIVSQQIRTNNEASIALHQCLDFEASGDPYRNAKGNEVVDYRKVL